MASLEGRVINGSSWDESFPWIFGEALSINEKKTVIILIAIPNKIISKYSILFPLEKGERTKFESNLLEITSCQTYPPFLSLEKRNDSQRVGKFRFEDFQQADPNSKLRQKLPGFLEITA